MKFKWDQFRRLKREGTDGFTRGQKDNTRRAIKLRREAEIKLEEGKYDWMEFLKVVSYTNDPITNDLEQQFVENGNQVYEGEDLDFDPNDNGENTCMNCDLKIFEKYMLYPCGDDNICFDCIEDIKAQAQVQGSPQGVLGTCPNEDCKKEFREVLQKKQRK